MVVILIGITVGLRKRSKVETGFMLWISYPLWRFSKCTCPVHIDSFSADDSIAIDSFLFPVHWMASFAFAFTMSQQHACHSPFVEGMIMS